jgi:hypothetical protein
MKTSIKTVYVLRLRPNDAAPWGEPEYFKKQKERDNAERICRIIGGLRTHSYEEKKTPEEIEELCD